MNCLSVVIVTLAVLCLVQVDSATKFVLTCHFNIVSSPGNVTYYACNLYNLNITTKNVQIDAFNGTHLPGKNDSDVSQIQFQNGTMFYVPNGIGSLFKNLKRFMVGNESSLDDLGTKALTRLNVKNMSNLELISFVSNDIKKLDKDALWDLTKLEVFMLTAQRLNFLNVRVFERNTKLIGVYINSTELLHLYENVFKYNFLLKTVAIENNIIETIHEGTFVRNSKLRRVSLRSNKIESLAENLFQHNPSLHEVDFGDNSLEQIKIDFTKFKNITHIDFEYNNCIHAIYDDRSTNAHIYTNLTIFQNLIKSNCNSHPRSGLRIL